MTIAGIVKHLAWVEDLWFQGRFVGGQMPAPWDRPGADGADESMRLVAGDSVESIAELYIAACDRSRRDAAECPSLSQPAAVARSEEHKSELQSLMRISYAVFCVQKKTDQTKAHTRTKSITKQLYIQ